MENDYATCFYVLVMCSVEPKPDRQSAVKLSHVVRWTTRGRCKRHVSATTGSTSHKHITQAEEYVNMIKFILYRLAARPSSSAVLSRSTLRRRVDSKPSCRPSFRGSALADAMCVF